MKINWIRSLFRPAPSPRMQPSEPRDRFGREPWKFQKNATVSERSFQREYQRWLSGQGDCNFAKGVYISPNATINTAHLVLGKNTAIGSETQIGIDLEMGERCTVNAGAIVRGKVRIGNDVRIASGAQVLGFNHEINDLTRVIHELNIVKKGITIGDDVWIGANAVILDGVHIGSHAVIGAGSVVTRDVPDWIVVVGNPARPLRSRKYGRAGNRESLLEDWRQFNEKVISGMTVVLERSRRAESFVDFPKDVQKVRSWADAVELSAMTGVPLPGCRQDEIIDRLKSFQDPETGLVPGHYGEDKLKASRANTTRLMCNHSAYMVMAVGYALECLGSCLAYPVRVAHDLGHEELLNHLKSLPWERRAWISGAWIDHFATACFFNARHHDLQRDMSDLAGWLYLNADSQTGMWGKPAGANDWLQPANGFYRLTRGTYSQWGWALPYPKQSIDTILNHANNPKYFGPDQATACYVLDIIHPLWLCLKTADYRRAEIEAVAQFWLTDIMKRWIPGEGFAFETRPGAMPRLQGTEMWLSIGWYCADLLGLIELVDGYKPLGVHRTETVQKPLRT